MHAGSSGSSPLPARQSEAGCAKRFGRRSFLAAASAAAATAMAGCGKQARRPNILLVMTDDQGWGDLSAGGNTILETPNMDRVAEEGMRFDNFHVSPVCAPTRASLMTGRYNYRTGVVDTFKGRAMMYPDEVTVAELLRGGGYRTGIFGKWHLGDNFPLRPKDQGFETSLVHNGGGIGQPSDPPGNRYLNPMLLENGAEKRFEGYCTDIFANAAMRFIEAHRDEPFFCYVATNTPHTPLEVPEEWVAPFHGTGLSDGEAKLYAMVKNIDDNLGKLLAKLAQLDLDRDTVVFFLTDNGAGGPKRFNAGLRGFKGSVYEGGIRVPLFVRWPGRIAPGSHCERLAAHIDLLPTICEYAGVKPPHAPRIDGRSLAPLLDGRTGGWAGRTFFTQWHRGDQPIPRESAAVVTERYKLVLQRDLTNGFELFDLTNDPGETTDLSGKLPQIAAELRRRYDNWFASVSATRGYAPPRIYVGAPEENPVRLTRQDWRGPRAGYAEETGVLGYWEVDVRRGGNYRARLEGLPTDSVRTARFRLNGVDAGMPLAAGERACEFSNLAIPAGLGDAEAWFEGVNAEGEKAPVGVWYLYLELLP
ncbi:MAG: arylsulfatase [Bryobacterales bacterium]|nr:arylsulfatase [Bryobacterales bacterium]